MAWQYPTPATVTHPPRTDSPRRPRHRTAKRPVSRNAARRSQEQTPHRQTATETQRVLQTQAPPQKKVLGEERGATVPRVEPPAASLALVDPVDPVAKHCRGVAERYPITDRGCLAGVMSPATRPCL